jgi:hypothetical protein
LFTLVLRPVALATGLFFPDPAAARKDFPPPRPAAMLPAMNWEPYVWLGWAVVYVVVGGLAGVSLVLLAASVLPKLIDRLTPHLDEGKEIARGNQAVAIYFGLVVGACILGVSLVIAAAVLGGVIAALH